ncbi:hypothetical protein CPC08DRAFT_619481, partial [Agrocybe pediades]
KLDQRIRALPPAYGLRHFKNGISALSQISGSERKNMAKILLGCLIGAIPILGIKAITALLDFIYIAQYSSHDTQSLGYLKDALDRFHRYRDYFIQAGVRDDFNIPKFHSLLHYIPSIEQFGTTDNYNTEMFERLHIDFAKSGWRASNRRDEFPQMIKWLSRREKIASLEAHNAPGFTAALKTFLNAYADKPTNQRRLPDLDLPFTKVNVYSMFRFHPESIQDGEEEKDVVKAMPKSARLPHGRFDTVIVNYKDNAMSTGVEGTRVGRVKVIFTLPDTLDTLLGPKKRPSAWPRGKSEPLAYVEWYSSFAGAVEERHGNMYQVKRAINSKGDISGDIVSLSTIRQSCMLIPIFPPIKEKVPDIWSTSTVLDEATSFLVNNWSSKYAYQTIW